MAANTDISLQNQIIYSVYVRNHTPEGTFNAVIPDLDRIKALGTDIIWFMPIHPIGVVGHKGSLGCPYANMDYRTVNPEYGTMEDFKALVNEIHKRGMKCMIDVVYNHTSPDSTLTKEHPEFFFRNSAGEFANKAGEWADVVDLDYDNKELWDYQIESLKMWAGIVDGFRCDVASFVPLDFWKAAREAVEKVHPGFIWLAETVFMEHGNHMRSIGLYSGKDCDMYDAFDMEYDYDIRSVFHGYMEGKAQLSHFVDCLNRQEAIYPDNYNKMRCLENHDMPRIASWGLDGAELENFTAFLYFMKGTTLIYAGQEFVNDHTPSLFDKDVIDWDTGRDISPMLAKLGQVKKQNFGCDDHFAAKADNENHIVCAKRIGSLGKAFGVFSLKGMSAEVETDVPDGSYVNLIDGVEIAVKGGRLLCGGKPIIFKIK